LRITHSMFAIGPQVSVFAFMFASVLVRILTAISTANEILR
jgi:hypothetical protein